MKRSNKKDETKKGIYGWKNTKKIIFDPFGSLLVVKYFLLNFICVITKIDKF